MYFSAWKVLLGAESILKIEQTDERTEMMYVKFIERRNGNGLPTLK